MKETLVILEYLYLSSAEHESPLKIVLSCTINVTQMLSTKRHLEDYKEVSEIETETRSLSSNPTDASSTISTIIESLVGYLCLVPYVCCALLSKTITN